mgnify:CR=1 FL=1
MSFVFWVFFVFLWGNQSPHAPRQRRLHRGAATAQSPLATREANRRATRGTARRESKGTNSLCPKDTRQRLKLARSSRLRKNLPRTTSCDQPAQRREKMMNDGNKSAKLAHHSAIDSRIVRNAFVELALPHWERTGWFAPLQWGNWV